MRMLRRQICTGLAGGLLLAMASSVKAQTDKPCPIEDIREFILYFDIASTDVTVDGMAVIAAFAGFYKSSATSAGPCRSAGKMSKVTVKGHTDTVGSPAANMILSRKRADIVTDKLVKLGVPREIITVEGHGEEELAIATGDQVAEPLNRRVTIDPIF